LPIWFAKRRSEQSGIRGRFGLNGSQTQQARLWTGLLLMAYAASHLVNHMIGLWSLSDMEAARYYFVGFWRSWPGTVALGGAAVVHVALSLIKLGSRRTWRLPLWQWAQIALGLSIPLILAEHVLATRISHELFGLEDRYAYVLNGTWPDQGWKMMCLIGVVWLHGCIGVHYWARLFPTYRRLQPYLLAVAVLLPTLAFTGYASAGREVAQLREADPEWTERLSIAIGSPGEAASAFVARGERAADIALLFFVLAVASVHFLRVIDIGNRGLTVSYPGQRQVMVPRGFTVLEASRMGGIPHAAVCGGRGRCSTCRVRVGGGAGSLATPSSREQRVLRRIGAPPNVRLACQIRVNAPLDVTPLLPPDTSPEAAPEGDNGHGRELNLAVLFCDIRDFTAFSEHRLPYDVVFVLNQYFRAVSDEIEAYGGYVDKFIGDGIMALFGLETEPAIACRQALNAVRAISERLEALNRQLSNELAEPLRIGIGLHVGHVIVGEMGHGRAASLTAIGDAVNVASRLEIATKDYQCEAVVSESLMEIAGISVSELPHAELPIRGRSQPLPVVLLRHGRDLRTAFTVPTFP
jgi:adenylate cyclase